MSQLRQKEDNIFRAYVYYVLCMFIWMYVQLYIYFLSTRSSLKGLLDCDLWHIISNFSVYSVT